MAVRLHAKPFTWLKSSCFVDRLTTDIILEIFSIMAEADFSIRAMGATCRRWRDVYLNTSKFWSHICLFPPRIDPQWDSKALCGFNFDGLYALGRRIGRRLLTIDMTSGESVPNFVVRKVIKQLPIFINAFPLALWNTLLLGRNGMVIQALVKYVPYLFRLKHVIAIVYSGRVHAFLLALSQEPVRLRKLEFKTAVVERNNSMSNSWISQEELWANLFERDTVFIVPRTMQWNGYTPTATLVTYHSPQSWLKTRNTRVTNLTLRDSLLTPGFQPHLHLPNLEIFICHNVAYTNTLGIISFPALKRLEIHHGSISLVGHICAPQLETLALSSNIKSINQAITPSQAQGEQTEVIPLKWFMHRSPRIEKLSIEISAPTEWSPSMLEGLCSLLVGSRDQEQSSPGCQHPVRLSVRLHSIQRIWDRDSAKRFAQILLDACRRLREVLIDWSDGSVVHVPR